MEPYFDVQRTQTRASLLRILCMVEEQDAEAAPAHTLASPIFHAAKVLRTGKKRQGPGCTLVTGPNTCAYLPQAGCQDFKPDVMYQLEQGGFLPWKLWRGIPRDPSPGEEMGRRLEVSRSTGHRRNPQGKSDLPREQSLRRSCLLPLRILSCMSPAPSGGFLSAWAPPTLHWLSSFLLLGMPPSPCHQAFCPWEKPISGQ